MSKLGPMKSWRICGQFVIIISDPDVNIDNPDAGFEAFALNNDPTNMKKGMKGLWKGSLEGFFVLT